MPLFAINARRPEIEALAADERVIRIQRDLPYAPLLDKSVPLIGITNGLLKLGTGNGQAVVVIDTGVQADHPFVDGRVIAEACFSTPDESIGARGLCPNGTNFEQGPGSASPTTKACLGASKSILCWHGTHVAGIAAGSNKPGSVPPYGVAKGADIVAIQVFRRIDSESECDKSKQQAPCLSALMSDIARALAWVIVSRSEFLPTKIAAINLSLGFGRHPAKCDADSILTPLITKLRRKHGVATIIAAGNDGYDDAVGDPGCISTAITVGSTTKNAEDTRVSCFSNMGAMVDLLAPGGFAGGYDDGADTPPCAKLIGVEDIYSSVPNRSIFPKRTFDYAWGTSMAAPHVAGAFALLRSIQGDLTVDDIETALVTMGTPVNGRVDETPTTKRLIQVDQALSQLGKVAKGLQVSPDAGIVAAVTQGGAFQSIAFEYLVKATRGLIQFEISGLPDWLSASPTNGTAGSAPTNVLFKIEPSAWSLAQGPHEAIVTFKNKTNDKGTQIRSAGLNVNVPAKTLQVFATGNMAASGVEGGPFEPMSFTYQMKASSDSLRYSISGLPSWLTVEPASGKLTTVPTAVTFTIDKSAESLPRNVYPATITFKNETNDKGTQTRTATLTVDRGTPTASVQAITAGFAFGMSADGQVVAGNGVDAYRWTQGDGAVVIAIDSRAMAVSADGIAVVGNSGHSCCSEQAYRWRAADGIVPIDNLSGFGRSFARAVNADGSVVVGDNVSPSSRAFIWTPSGGTVALGLLPNTSISSARGVSADGRIVVGWARAVAGATIPVVWTDGGSPTPLEGTFPANNSPLGISADGKVVVGFVEGGTRQAFRWTAQTGPVNVDTVEGRYSEAAATSADGGVVVGYFNNSPTETAFRWTEVDGVRPVSDLLADAGIDVTGWRFRFANGVSADGTVIVGSGQTPSGENVGWVARLPLPPVPTASKASSRKSVIVRR
jgi:subtilisin family serine protease/uncharacterized membrane protein